MILTGKVENLCRQLTPGPCWPESINSGLPGLFHFESWLATHLPSSAFPTKSWKSRLAGSPESIPGSTSRTNWEKSRKRKHWQNITSFWNPLPPEPGEFRKHSEGPCGNPAQPPACFPLTQESCLYIPQFLHLQKLKGLPLKTQLHGYSKYLKQCPALHRGFMTADI